MRGWSYIQRSERSCIRNRSRVGRADRGLVSRKDGGRSGRAEFERRCIRDTARIQRVLIGDRYALQSERVIFYPIIPDQGIKGRVRISPLFALILTFFLPSFRRYICTL